MALTNLFINLDFMSEALAFENNGSKNFKSCLGALVSMLVIVVSIIISSFFSIELVERKLPITSSYSNYIDNSEFDLKNFPLFFMISDTAAKALVNYEDYFDVYAGILNRTNSIKNTYDFYIHKSKRCIKEDLSVLEKYIGEEELMRILKLPIICFNYENDSVIKNDFAYTNSSYVNLNFEYCNPNVRKCADDIKQRQNDFYIRTYFVNNYVNTFDYSNPINFFLDSHLQQVSSGVMRRNFIRFTINQFISDNGWLLENKNETEFISFKSINVETNANPPDFPNSYYWITVTSPQIRTITYRSYLKVQELAAKIGGIINAINITAYLIFSNYLRFIYVCNVSKHIIEGELKQKESKIIQSFTNKDGKFNFDFDRLKDINDRNNIESDNNVKSLNNNNSNILSLNKSNLRNNLNRNKDSSNLNFSEVENSKHKINESNKKILNKDAINEKKKIEIAKIIDLKQEYSNQELSKNLDYISNISYFEYLYETIKENLFCCCLDNDEYFIRIQYFLNKNLDFFNNIKKLTILSGFTDNIDD